MSYSQLLVGLLLVSVLFGCKTAPRVVHYLNEELDYSEYRTYKMISINTDRSKIPIQALVLYNQIEKGIIDNMEQREYVPGRNPDIIVSYDFIGSQRTETRSMNYYDPYVYYAPPVHYNVTIKEGILIVEFRDRKRKKLIWQSSIDINFEEASPADEAYEAVEYVFDKYPYKAGSNEKIAAEKSKKREGNKKNHSLD